MGQDLRSLREAIKGRRQELAAYETEERLHLAELAALTADGVPDQWPDELLQFRSLKRDELIANASPDSLELVADLQAQDRARGALGAVAIEKRTSLRRLNALLAELPEGEPESIGNSLDVGLGQLQKMVDDPASPVEGFAVDASSLRTLDDGTGVGVVTLKLADNTTARKAVVVRPDGTSLIVDSE